MRPLGLDPSMRTRCVLPLSQHAGTSPGQEGCTGLLPRPAHSSDYIRLLPVKMSRARSKETGPSLSSHFNNNNNKVWKEHHTHSLPSPALLSSQVLKFIPVRALCSLRKAKRRDTCIETKLDYFRGSSHLEKSLLWHLVLHLPVTASSPVLTWSEHQIPYHSLCGSSARVSVLN